MIDNDSILWITHQVSSTPIDQARKRREAMIFNLRNRTFSDIYVFQRLNVDPGTGRMTFREGDDLGPDFVLEPVREERMRGLTLTRLSRLTAIRDGAATTTGIDPATHTVPKDRASIERMRHDYMDNFIKQLP